MVADIPMEEYLAEIRQQVCRCCVERPPGGPPCEPLGKVCGIEMHLPKLVEAIHSIDSRWIRAYLGHNREVICQQCAFHHSSICPCPMDQLVFLVVQAVTAVDERHEAEAAEEADIGETAVEGPPTLEAIVHLYEQTTGRWIGCDWPTSFGRDRLDLNGVASATALANAASTSTTGSDWHDAALWLARVERYACEAEREASKAVAAAQAGAWASAADHAERAFALEFATGRSLWSRPSQTWHTLHQAIQAAARAQRPVVAFSRSY